MTVGLLNVSFVFLAAPVLAGMFFLIRSIYRDVKDIAENSDWRPVARSKAKEAKEFFKESLVILRRTYLRVKRAREGARLIEN